ncbi:MAG TPA: hypothetical protein VF624_03290 [Tepidisphaeraceae bacterium]|jgi:hypothetical protein
MRAIGALEHRYDYDGYTVCGPCFGQLQAQDEFAERLTANAAPQPLIEMPVPRRPIPAAVATELPPEDAVDEDTVAEFAYIPSTPATTHRPPVRQKPKPPSPVLWTTITLLFSLSLTAGTVYLFKSGVLNQPKKPAPPDKLIVATELDGDLRLSRAAAMTAAAGGNLQTAVSKVEEALQRIRQDGSDHYNNQQRDFESLLTTYRSELAKSDNPRSPEPKPNPPNPDARAEIEQLIASAEQSSATGSKPAAALKLETALKIAKRDPPKYAGEIKRIEQQLGEVRGPPAEPPGLPPRPPIPITPPQGELESLLSTNVDRLHMSGWEALRRKSPVIAGAYFDRVLKLDSVHAQAQLGKLVVTHDPRDVVGMTTGLERIGRLRGGSDGRLALAITVLDADPGRAALLLREQLASAPNDDEQVLNILGLALQRCDEKEIDTLDLTAARQLYLQKEERLHQSRPGQKRWGAQWLPSAKAEANWTAWRTLRERLPATARRLEDADARYQQALRFYEGLRASTAKPESLAAAQVRMIAARKERETAIQDGRQIQADLAQLGKPPFGESPILVDALVKRVVAVNR